MLLKGKLGSVPRAACHVLYHPFTIQPTSLTLLPIPVSAHSPEGHHGQEPSLQEGQWHKNRDPARGNLSSEKTARLQALEKPQQSSGQHKGHIPVPTRNLYTTLYQSLQYCLDSPWGPTPLGSQGTILHPLLREEGEKETPSSRSVP